jgi:hypothetical protein
MAAIAGHGSPGRHRNPFLPELAERLHNLSRAGFDATLIPHRYPTTTPRQRSGGESSTNYPDKPRTRTKRQPPVRAVAISPLTIVPPLDPVAGPESDESQDDQRQAERIDDVRRVVLIDCSGSNGQIGSGRTASTPPTIALSRPHTRIVIKTRRCEPGRA